MSKVYVTKQGDMWDSIAFNEMGSTSYTDVLMGANGNHVGTHIFSAGVELIIPEVNIPDASSKTIPWKR